jgi:hypothetical protein
MKLDIQIYSLGYSFLFGCIFYILLDIFYNFVYVKKVILRIIFSFIFTMGMAIFYFVGLLYINNGYLHIYFIVSILVGYIFSYLLTKSSLHIKKKM